MAKGGWVGALASGMPVLIVTLPVVVGNLIRLIVSIVAVAVANKSSCTDSFTSWVAITGYIGIAQAIWYLLLSMVMMGGERGTDDKAFTLLIGTSSIISILFGVWYGMGIERAITSMGCNSSVTGAGITAFVVDGACLLVGVFVVLYTIVTSAAKIAQLTTKCHLLP